MKRSILVAAALCLLPSGPCHADITAAKLKEATVKAFNESDAKPLENEIKKPDLPNDKKAAARITVEILAELGKRGRNLTQAQADALAAQISLLYLPVADPKLEEQRKNAQTKLMGLTEDQLNKYISDSLGTIRTALDKQGANKEKGGELNFNKFRDDVHATCKYWPLCWLLG